MSIKKIIKNVKKIRATVENAKKIVEIQKQHGSFANYIEKFKDNPIILANNLVEEFKYLGRETVWDFLKSIGLDAIKPDIHVRRILFRLGLISSCKPHPKVEEEVFEVAKKISKSTGEKLGVIDAIIWFYGADMPNLIKKPICGKKPRCNECNLTELCKHYKNKTLLKFLNNKKIH